MSDTTFTPKIWGFRASNPLDYVGKTLQTPDGKRVEIENHERFVIRVNGEWYAATDDNAACSYVLNQLQAG